MVKLWGLSEQEKLNKKEVVFLHVSIKKEKIPLVFFPSTISQSKLDQATGIKNMQYLEMLFR